MEPNNLALDQYILVQAANKKPKVCFVPTASGDAEAYIDRFYAAFKKLHCVPSHLTLFKANQPHLEQYIKSQDVIYVGGGNTKNMLALWREWHIDTYLKEAWHNGTIMAGISAGSICWFHQGLTDSLPGKLMPIKCLGFLQGSNCPHYDGEKQRRPAYHKCIESGEMKPGYAADDGAALHFVDGKLYQVVTSRPNAKAYQVTVANRKISEIPLPVTTLLD